MKNILLPIVALLLTYGFTFSQSKNDLLYLQNEVKEVSILEVGNSLIKYSYPGEEVMYSVNKTLVNKIEFSNGRSEVFKSPFKEVNYLTDAQKVFVTFNPDEVEGLQMKGELFSKAVGVTTLSSVNNVNNRALNKLKTEAAMMGANALYIGNQFQRGNQYGNEYTPGNSTMTTYSAQAYSSYTLDIEAAKELINGNKFYYHQKIDLGRNDWNPKVTIKESVDDDSNPILFELGEIMEIDGDLFVAPQHLKYKNDYLQVIRIGEDSITLMDRTGKGVVNFDLLAEKNLLVQNLLKLAQTPKTTNDERNL